MKLDYSVTFEFDIRAPVTDKGTVETGSVYTCASRAVKLAKQRLKPHSWGSVVVVLTRTIDEARES